MLVDVPPVRPRPVEHHAGYDDIDDAAPAATMRLVERGTAFHADRLAASTDDDVDAPSLLPRWSRRFVVAHVRLSARGLTLISWARTGSRLRRPAWW